MKTVTRQLKYKILKVYRTVYRGGGEYPTGKFFYQDT